MIEIIKMYFRPDDYCYAHARYQCAGCKQLLVLPIADSLTPIKPAKSPHPDWVVSVVDNG